MPMVHPAAADATIAGLAKDLAAAEWSRDQLGIERDKAIAERDRARAVVDLFDRVFHGPPPVPRPGRTAMYEAVDAMAAERAAR